LLLNDLQSSTFLIDTSFLVTVFQLQQAEAYLTPQNFDSTHHEYSIYRSPPFRQLSYYDVAFLFEKDDIRTSLVSEPVGGIKLDIWTKLKARNPR
jgi:hypothetical protein